MLRSALIGILAALMASAVSAEERLVKAGAVFPMLDKFYATAPAERSLLSPSFTVLRDGKPAPEAHLSLVVEGRRTPLPLGPDARLERLPTAAELATGAQVAVDAPKGPLGMKIDLNAAIRPATEISANDCQRAIGQANAFVHHAAGLLAMAAPQLKAATFPGAGSGVAVMPDGKAISLPLANGAPSYDPAAIKGAKTIRLAKTPSYIGLN
jgi:hypothetical protein